MKSFTFSDKPDGYFTGGWVELDNGEAQYITWHGGDTITLLAALSTWDTGYVLSCRPGCDKSQASCNTFNNIGNFGGFPYIPYENIYSDGV